MRCTNGRVCFTSATTTSTATLSVMFYVTCTTSATAATLSVMFYVTCTTSATAATLYL